MVKVSEIACILKQMNELDASKQREFLPVTYAKLSSQLRSSITPWIAWHVSLSNCIFFLWQRMHNYSVAISTNLFTYWMRINNNLITWKYQERKYIIGKMKYAPCGPVQFICRILHYRFLSLFLVRDQHCMLLHFQLDTLGIRIYYEVNCCCIIPHALHTYHIVWQYHGSY